MESAGNAPLFRREVIESRRQRYYGEVRLDTPLSVWAITGVVVMLIVLFILILVFGDFARRETVTGWLTPDKGLVRASVTEGGVIERVGVSEGDVVAAGDTLFVVRRDSGLVSGGTANVRLLEQLAEERAQLSKRLSLTEGRYEANAKRLTERRDGLQAERIPLTRQLAVQKERIVIAERQLARIEPLVKKGVISRFDRQKRKEALLTQRQNYEDLIGQIAAADRELAELNRNISALPTERAAALAELRERLATLDQRITEMKSRSSVAVRAPVAGRVAVVIARVGQNVRAGEMQVMLLPKGGRLEAEMFVPSRAAGFIKSGQDVRLRYDAFPYQKFGTGKARVIAVSKTILNPDDVSAPLGLREPVFRVIARLEKEAVSADGERIPLQAGMTLRADIVIEHRKLWEVFLGSLSAGF